MFRRWDNWIGRRGFHPLVIRLCWWTGWTQYAVSGAAWVVATLCLLRVLWATPLIGTWGQIILCIAWIPAIFLRAHLFIDRPDEALPSYFSSRMVLWAMLFMRIVPTVSLVYLRALTHYEIMSGLWFVLFNSTALFAEYARTIDTIPPKPKKEPKSHVHSHAYYG